jgi:hypothetical protein
MVSMKPQINLRLQDELRRRAERYAKFHGFRNIQELAAIAIREKIERQDYDEKITSKEVELIDSIITATMKKGRFISKEELFKDIK